MFHTTDTFRCDGRGPPVVRQYRRLLVGWVGGVGQRVVLQGQGLEAAHGRKHPQYTRVPATGERAGSYCRVRVWRQTPAVHPGPCNKGESRVVL